MSQSKTTILVIDDDEDFAAAVKAILEKGGYRALCANGPKEGFSLLEAEAPGLVILDMMMEGKGAGFLFSRAVRKDTRYAGLPILMLTGMREQTGFSFPGRDKDEKWLPVDDFAEKPLGPKELLERVGLLLRRASGGPASES